MKALVFAITFLFTSSNLSAQIWVEDNAVWHYDFWNIAAQGGFYKVSHSGDSVLAGKSCKRFNIDRHSFSIYTGSPVSNDTIIDNGNALFGKEHTYQSNDSVYRWDGSQFQLLFDFGAQVGDSWVISIDPSPFEASCTDSSIVEVMDTGLENINGIDYRYITLQSSMEAAWSLNGTFNERFGGSYVFPRPGDNPCALLIAELDIISFKCFEDDSMSLYNPSGEDCEYLLTHLGGAESEIDQFIIAPNPTSKTVEISGGTVSMIEVYKLNGEQVFSMTNIDNTVVIDLESFEAGVYILRLTTNDGVVTKRIIKE
jgi:hypothetical protein